MQNKETNKKIELLELLKKETTYKFWEGSSGSSEPDEYGHVVIECKTFGESWLITYQDGEYDNPGANDGLTDLLNILIEKEEFQLIDNDPSYIEYELIELISEFCKYIRDKENIDY